MRCAVKWWCIFLGCRPTPGTCLCKRCGREVHAWKIVASRELQREMVGRTNDKCIYDCIDLVKEVCTRCHATREQERLVQRQN